MAGPRKRLGLGLATSADFARRFPILMMLPLWPRESAMFVKLGNPAFWPQMGKWQSPRARRCVTAVRKFQQCCCQSGLVGKEANTITHTHTQTNVCDFCSAPVATWECSCWHCSEVPGCIILRPPRPGHYFFKSRGTGCEARSMTERQQVLQWLAHVQAELWAGCRGGGSVVVVILVFLLRQCFFLAVILR